MFFFLKYSGKKSLAGTTNDALVMPLPIVPIRRWLKQHKKLLEKPIPADPAFGAITASHFPISALFVQRNSRSIKITNGRSK